MQPIKIATAQFEHRSNDKVYNLGVIRQLAAQAKAQEKLTQAGAYRYKNARRPELYGAILSAQHKAVQQVAWMKGE